MRFILCLWLLLGCYLQADKASEKVFMWSVEDSGSKAYLLGSIHVGNKDLYPMDQAIENAFQESERIAVELDIDSIDPSSIAEEFENLAQLDEDESLFDILPSSLYFDLDKALYKHRIHLVQKDDLEPWYFFWMLSGLSTMGGNFNPDDGIDLYFIRQAKDREIPVLSIESIELQMQVFAGFDRPTQIDLLQGSLNQLGEAEDSLEKIFASWEAGDADGLLTILNNAADDEASEETLAAFEKRLLIDRNIKMADFVESSLKEGGTTFVVVGALHLVGSQGIVEILKERGYSVEQMSAKGRHD